MIHKPPIWADRFLEWFCNPDLLEEIQGDLYELYDEQVKAGRQDRANWQFVYLVFRNLRYSVIARKKSPTVMMTRNNFKIAWRVIWKHKFNSILNILGLAIGVASFFLMGTYVRQELSYDQFHSQKDNIYRVWLKEDYGNDKLFFNSVTPWRFEQLLETDFGEFKEVVQIDDLNFLVGEGEDRNNESVYVISPELFDVFDFKVISAQGDKPLPNKNAVILSGDYAIKYFGDKDPLGKSLTLQIGEEDREFIVSAVYENIPDGSSINFNIAISSANNLDIYGEGALEAWFSVSPETYVLLNENSNIESVNARMQDVVMTYLEGRLERGVYNIGFQPLTEIHLDQAIPPGMAPVGNKSYVYILGAICIMIIAIACINYTTLSIGQSIQRGKEVGVRKILGALRSSLLQQYLTESILISFFSLIIGLGLAFVFLPLFNDLTGANISLVLDSMVVFLSFCLLIIIGISSGIYPAFILSRLEITKIFQGMSPVGRSNFLRKGMVVFQFLITVFLISSTIIIRDQLDYMMNKDIGINYNATVSVPLYPDPSAGRLTEVIGTAMEKGEILREKLSQYPDVTDIGLGSHVFGSSGWGNGSYTDDTETFRSFRMLFTDAAYFETFGIKLIDGRGFDSESALDRRESIILNEAAVAHFGLENPIGRSLPGYEPGVHAIIGVTEDFNYSSLHTTVEPLIISQNPANIYSQISDHNYGDSPVPKLVFRYTGSNLLRVGEILEKEWKGTFSAEELSFSFVEENMRYQYESEAKLGSLVVVSSILSLVIACLGLIGLAVLVTNNRTKEIGIRKVIGASEFSIFGMLLKRFAIQLFIGIVLSVPLTWWLMQNWLESFAYRITINPVVFILSGVIALIIALGVISFHTLKASLNNPVDSLKIE